MSKQIRNIKREMLEDDRISALTDRAFRIWVSSILLADDHGRFRANARQIRSAIYWAQDDVAAADVEASLAELFASGLALPYVVNSERFAFLPAWARHQRVDNASPPKCPDPNGPNGEQFSRAANRGEPRQSAAVRGESRQLADRNPTPSANRGPSTGVVGGSPLAQSCGRKIPLVSPDRDSLSPPEPGISSLPCLGGDPDGESPVSEDAGEVTGVRRAPFAGTDPRTRPGDSDGPEVKPDAASVPEGKQGAKPRAADPMGDSDIGSAWADGVTAGGGVKVGRPSMGELRALVALVDDHGPPRSTPGSFGGMRAACDWARAKGEAFGRASVGQVKSVFRFKDWISAGEPADAGRPGRITQQAPASGRLWKIEGAK